MIARFKDEYLVRDIFTYIDRVLYEISSVKTVNDVILIYLKNSRGKIAIVEAKGFETDEDSIVKLITAIELKELLSGQNHIKVKQQTVSLFVREYSL